MTPHEARRLELAVWYTREAILCAAQNDTEGEEAHISAALDYIEQLEGKRPRMFSTEELTAWACAYQERAIQRA